MSVAKHIVTCVICLLCWHTAHADEKKMLLQQHPLVGKIFAPQSQSFLDQQALRKTLVQTPLVLIGETHDNPIHHQIQHQVLSWLLAANRKPTIIFEMLDDNQKPAIQKALNTCVLEPTALNTLLTWDQRGWRNWADYYPLFKTAIQHQLAIKPGNYAIDVIKAIGQDGHSAIPAELNITAQTPLSEPARQALTEEIIESHCNMLPEHFVPNMGMVQRIRDRKMALMLSDATTRKDALLIAGSGHVRTDRGAPHYLPDANIASIALIEVDAELLKPEDYTDLWYQDRIPHDYVWFTARFERPDMCAQLRAHFRKKKTQR